jgi:hypothetical protein
MEEEEQPEAESGPFVVEMLTSQQSSGGNSC